MTERPVALPDAAHPEFPAAPWCLFLDVDGTLLDLAPTPDAVRVDGALVDLLRRVQRACDGALALITGRSIDIVDSLFHPLRLPVAGVHGFERRNAEGDYLRPAFVGEGLDRLRGEVAALAQAMPGVLLEDKGSALALHYRHAPALESAIRTRLDELVASMPSFELLEGNFVFEIKPVEHDKATAVEAFMQERPFAGRRPIFVGDDTTDLDGFAAVRRFNGLAIAVGPRVPGESRLSGPREVRAWLEDLIRDTPRERPA